MTTVADAPPSHSPHASPSISPQTSKVDSPQPTADAPSSPAPRSAGRLAGLDIARGIAMLGMMVAHVALTTDDLTTIQGWLGFSHGRASILFATLAGISLGILTGGPRPYTGVKALQARTRILVRGALLFGFGGALAALGTPIVLILAYYGAWFVAALPFVKLNARKLLILGVAVGIGGSIARTYISDVINRIGGGLSSDANFTAVDVFVTGIYPGLVWMGFVFVGMGLSRLDLRSTAVLVRMVVVGLLVAGLGYGASAVLTRAVGEAPPAAVDQTDPAEEQGDESMLPVEVSGTQTDPNAIVYPDGTVEQPDGTLIYPDGVTIMPNGTALNADGTTMTDEQYNLWLDEFFDNTNTATDNSPPLFDTESPLPDARELLVDAPHSGTPFEFLGSGGVALVIIGLCSLAPAFLRKLLFPLAAVGSMSLTIYSMHVLAVWLAPSLYVERVIGNWGVVTMIVGAMIFASVWSLTLGRGPLERIMRSVSIKAANVD